MHKYFTATLISREICPVSSCIEPFILFCFLLNLLLYCSSLEEVVVFKWLLLIAHAPRGFGCGAHQSSELRWMALNTISYFWIAKELMHMTKRLDFDMLIFIIHHYLSCFIHVYYVVCIYLVFLWLSYVVFTFGIIRHS